MQIAIIAGCWTVFTSIGYIIYKHNTTADKLRVMSCRRTLRKYSKMDEMDKKSIF